ncbi:hypothetical protein ACPA54_01620 [Uniformispora flossi]|uniref:hypothetical protein n=1 Tax=Uniformispora flossi TaxID=3390723 RepID=UPI003C2AFDC0
MPKPSRGQETNGELVVQPQDAQVTHPPVRRRQRFWENLPALLGVLAALIGAGFFGGCQVQQQVGAKEPVTVTTTQFVTVTAPAAPAAAGNGNQASPSTDAPSAASTSGAGSVQWTGKVRLGDVDLDSVPPSQVAYMDSDVGYNGMSRTLGIGPRAAETGSLAVASAGSRPTQQECATLLTTQGTTRNLKVTPGESEVFCVRTDRGRTASVDGFDGEFVTVTVWAK